MLTAGAWVEVGPCHLAAGCEWSGMHWHWGDRRFRTIAALTPDEVIELAADLRAQTTAPAGRRQPPERSTMPNRSEISGPRDFDPPVGYIDPKDQVGPGRAVAPTSEQESSDRECLGRATQWLGLLDVDDEHLLDRVQSRALGTTIDELEQIEQSAEDLEGIAQRLRLLRFSLRESLGAVTVRHDERRDERLSKRNPGADRPSYASPGPSAR